MNFKSPILPPVNEDYHVHLHVDEKGNIRTDCSSTIPDDDQRRILQAAIPKYQEALARINAKRTHSPIGTSQGPPVAKLVDIAIVNEADVAGQRVLTDTQHQSKGDTPTAFDPQAVKRPKKRRRRSSSENGSPCLQDDNSSHVTERSCSIETGESQSHILISIEIQDHQKLKEYLFDAFTSFQQINCRTLCKSWIRTIEPKKQVNHPYNGNLKVKGAQRVPPNDLSTQKDLDPEETKPKWWPSKEECPHKEPDHIKKERKHLERHNMGTSTDWSRTAGSSLSYPDEL